MTRLKRVRGKITYANVVSTLCLFLVLGGGAAFAASRLPKNSVGSKQIRKGAVSPSKLSPMTVKTLTGAKGPAGPRGATGATGATGPQGAGGPAGSAKAWVEVSNTGIILRQSGGVGVAKIPGTEGEYCITAGPYTTANSIGVAGLDWSDEDSGTGTFVAVANGAPYNHCAAGQFDVVTSVFNETGESVDSDAGFVFFVP